MPSLMKMLRSSTPESDTNTVDDASLHLLNEALKEHTSVTRPSFTSTISRLMVDSAIPSLLSYLACTTMETSPSFSILLFPLLQLWVGKLAKPLKKLFNKKHSTTSITGLTSSPSPETMEQLTIMVKQLVMDQHRTMFYTVTLSTTPPLPKTIPRRHTENLKVICKQLSLC